MSKIKLCVNIDHIATLREARGGIEPNPILGASICETSGADGITVHLREDRRHIQDRDVFLLKDVVKGKFNLEMALSDEIISIAKEIKPDQITLVPEKREELTTEGGLDVKAHYDKIKKVTDEFHNLGILVSLFIEPDPGIVKLSHESGADYIELHTGKYSDSEDDESSLKELERLLNAGQIGVDIGIGINAGHGLNYLNTAAVLSIPGLEELNTGHSIIARSVFSGLSPAVKEMIDIVKSYK